MKKHVSEVCPQISGIEILHPKKCKFSAEFAFFTDRCTYEYFFFLLSLEEL